MNTATAILEFKRLAPLIFKSRSKIFRTHFTRAGQVWELLNNKPLFKAKHLEREIKQVVSRYLPPDEKASFSGLAEDAPLYSPSNRCKM